MKTMTIKSTTTLNTLKTKISEDLFNMFHRVIQWTNKLKKILLNIILRIFILLNMSIILLWDEKWGLL